MAPEKPLKPPFYRGEAECPQCGTVPYERKPHPKTGQRLDTGGIQRPEPTSIVCSCRYHARVISTMLVTEET